MKGYLHKRGDWLYQKRFFEIRGAADDAHLVYSESTEVRQRARSRDRCDGCKHRCFAQDEKLSESFALNNGLISSGPGERKTQQFQSATHRSQVMGDGTFRMSELFGPTSLASASNSKLGRGVSVCAQDACSIGTC